MILKRDHQVKLHLEANYLGKTCFLNFRKGRLFVIRYAVETSSMSEASLATERRELLIQPSHQEHLLLPTIWACDQHLPNILQLIIQPNLKGLHSRAHLHIQIYSFWCNMKHRKLIQYLGTTCYYVNAHLIEYNISPHSFNS